MRSCRKIEFSMFIKRTFADKLLLFFYIFFPLLNNLQKGYTNFWYANRWQKAVKGKTDKSAINKQYFSRVTSDLCDILSLLIFL